MYITDLKIEGCLHKLPKIDWCCSTILTFHLVYVAGSRSIVSPLQSPRILEPIIEKSEHSLCSAISMPQNPKSIDHDLPVWSKKRIEILEVLEPNKKKRQYPKYLQSWPMTNGWLLNKPYENEVTLRGQNIPLKQCRPLELLTQFERGSDLSMLKIWGLQVKALQSYLSSNFENDLNAD